MPSLKDFVAALQAGWFPALAAFVGSSIIVAGDYFKLPYLGSSPDLLLTIAVVIGVFSFSILIANIAYLPITIWKAFQRRNRRKEFRGKLVREVEAAPDSEKVILAYLVTSGRKAFAAEFNNQRLSPLVSKGFLVKLGGTNSVLEWPYIVRQEVWDYLIENQDSYRIEIPDRDFDPFHWRNTGW
ncbi:hypothetical protein [Phaeobacter italicus]|jgi:hypothetical protein|uniref:hypothetical protein n=1 Tax=Phaeobacter italicus TaxID=481446 RepID=UPI00232E8C16|nr:hypothetical protein [Phaeobacter italicus]